MSDNSPVTDWILRLKAGETGEVEQRLWEKYFQRLVALPRAKLGGVKTFEDEEDAALLALNSFFSRISNGRFPQLHDRSGLWPLLVKITLCKVGDVKRRNFAKKRDIRRNERFSTLIHEAPGDEAAMQLVHDCRALLDTLEDETLRQVYQLKLQGYTNREIAEQIGRTEVAVEWKLRILRKMIRQNLLDAG